MYNKNFQPSYNEQKKWDRVIQSLYYRHAWRISIEKRFNVKIETQTSDNFEIFSLHKIVSA